MKEPRKPKSYGPCCIGKAIGCECTCHVCPTCNLWRMDGPPGMPDRCYGHYGKKAEQASPPAPSAQEQLLDWLYPR